MEKNEFISRHNNLKDQIDSLKKEYLESNQPIPVGTFVTVLAGKEKKVYLKGQLKDYRLYADAGIIEFVIAPLRKNGIPHKSNEQWYDIDDKYYKVVPTGKDKET